MKPVSLAAFQASVAISSGSSLQAVQEFWHFNRSRASNCLRESI
jgi:hypothetical protein